MIDGISFGRADLATQLTEGLEIDVVARLTSRVFAGLETLQLDIRDVAPAGTLAGSGGPRPLPWSTRDPAASGPTRQPQRHLPAERVPGYGQGARPPATRHAEPVYRPPYLPGQEPLPSRERRRSSPVLAPLLALLGLLLVGGASVWAVSFLGLDLTAPAPWRRPSRAPARIPRPPGQPSWPSPRVSRSSRSPTPRSSRTSWRRPSASGPPSRAPSSSAAAGTSGRSPVRCCGGSRNPTPPSRTRARRGHRTAARSTSSGPRRSPPRRPREGGGYTFYVTDLVRMKVDTKRVGEGLRRAHQGARRPVVQARRTAGCQPRRRHRRGRRGRCTRPGCRGAQPLREGSDAEGRCSVR